MPGCGVGAVNRRFIVDARALGIVVFFQGVG